MSTFRGKFTEIPGIAADYFSENCYDCDVYFLSHCHTDHMVGLNSPVFQEMLKEKNRFIYVSHVTKAILKQLHPNIENQIRELDFHQTSTIIPLKEDESISVNLIPSGHCPGSVMFLFEYKEKRILYTGDYRITKNDLENIKIFYDSYGGIKKIHNIYLDTTFFLEKYSWFPSRKESLNEICNLIQEWTRNSENHMIDLATSARYGYEYIFMEISKRFKMPIHVNQDAYSFYNLIPEMDGAVTLDGNKTKIHSACGSSYRVTCACDDEKNKIRVIKLSAMIWGSKELENGITSNRCEYYRVCYSTHASFNEGIDLIKFLNPENVNPTVLRNNTQENEEIYKKINELLNKDNRLIKKPKLFDIEKIDNRINDVDMKNSIMKSENFNDIYESVLDSPPENDVVN